MSTRDPLSPPTVKPVLPVYDMGDGAAFYARLGFDVERFDSHYSIVSHSGHELFHLQVSDDLDRHSNPTSMYLHVSDADRWWAGVRSLDCGEIQADASDLWQRG